MIMQIFFTSEHDIDAQERICEHILDHMQIEWRWDDLPSDHLSIDMVKMIDYDVHKAIAIFQCMDISFTKKIINQ